MTRVQICTFALSTLFVLLSTTPSAATSRHAMSVDDMMKVEGLGAAASDPHGHFVFERLRPYEQADDFSFRTFAMGHTGHQLWRYDLERTGAVPEPLPGYDPAPHSYLQEFSPSGRFLTVMQYRLGALRLTAYDMIEEKAVAFEQTPAFSRDGAHNPVWISGDELMFAALPEGALPELSSVRVQTGRTLAKAWDDAWRGNVVTASEVRTVAPNRADHQEAGHLVRANARTGKSEVVADGLYADLRVSPDRRHLAALTVSGPQPTDPNKPAEDDLRRYRLTVFDLANNDSRILVPELEVFPYTIAWAPDGTRLAAYAWPAGETPRNGRFYVINLRSGAAVRYDHVGLDLASERERGWLQRPERAVFLGDDLAVFARRIPDSDPQTPRFTYQNVAPLDIPKPDWYALAADGTRRNLTSDLSGVTPVPVHAGATHITVTADDGAYRFYVDGQRRRVTPTLPGRFRHLSPGTFATRRGVIRPEFPDEALFDVSGAQQAKLVAVDLRDGHEGKIVVVDAPSADAMPLAGSIASGAVLFRVQDGPGSRLLVVADSDGATTREIARTNAHLDNVELGTWEVVSYEVADPEGRRPPHTIESCVLLPPDTRLGAPLPLVVEVYPDIGPRCSEGVQSIDYPNFNSPYLWAGRGYAYSRLTLPRALIRTANGPIAGMPAAVEAGVEALVAARIADPNRLVLQGFSQGGVSALYVAAHTQRFKAVIAINSWANLFSHYFGANGVYSSVYGAYFGDFGRYDSVAGTDFGIGKTPFEDPEVYIRNSPVFLAPRIDAPVLLVHTDMDSFSMSQFDEMYGALLRAGKDARYVRYWGEGHGPSSPANIRDLWERMDSFLIDSGMRPRETPEQSDKGAVPAS